MKFAQILRKRRKDLRLTQKEIADTLGIKDVNVSAWENGKGMPEASRLPALARRLEMTVSELMGDMRPAMGGKPARHTIVDEEPLEEVLADVADGARESATKMQWVSEDEATLLSNYRSANARSRGVIQSTAAGLPRASEQELAEVLTLRK